MLREYYHIDPDTYNPIDESVPGNVPTQQFMSSTAMYELVAWLNDTGNLFKLQLEILNDGNTS